MDSYFTVNYGQGETYGKFKAITLRLDKDCCSFGLPSNVCVLPEDMIPPYDQGKIEQYEDQHAPCALHSHYSYVDPDDEEEEFDSDGESTFDPETCALPDQEPSSC
mmetsp:Transcript_1014/g.1255  ORF Transcript_1014/g.1255 Transcript_1014/m.1255 type:complete len:106 (-) Transcript_1014:199-516(-)